MKKKVLKLIFITGISFFSIHARAQNPVNWTDEQLMQPSALADIMNTKKEDVTIISIGPFNTIPNAINIGMVSEKDKLDKFKKQLSALKKDQKIVIYCGCCPYEHCPNVRPAMDILKEMQFTTYYLLDLPKNLRVNWIDKGYPVVKQ